MTTTFPNTTFNTNTGFSTNPGAFNGSNVCASNAIPQTMSPTGFTGYGTPVGQPGVPTPFLGTNGYTPGFPGGYPTFFGPSTPTFGYGLSRFPTPFNWHPFGFNPWTPSNTYPTLNAMGNGFVQPSFFTPSYVPGNTFTGFNTPFFGYPSFANTFGGQFGTGTPSLTYGTGFPSFYGSTPCIDGWHGGIGFSPVNAFPTGFTGFHNGFGAMTPAFYGFNPGFTQNVGPSFNTGTPSFTNGYTGFGPTPIPFTANTTTTNNGTCGFGLARDVA